MDPARPRPLKRLTPLCAVLAVVGVAVAAPGVAAPRPPPRSAASVPLPHGVPAAASTPRGGQWFGEMGWDLEHVDYTLRVDPVGQWIEGEAALAFARTTGGPIFVHVPEGPEVTVAVDGVGTAPAWELDALRIEDPGADNVVTATWLAGPAPADLGLRFEGDFVYTWAEPYGARRWLAVFDEPHDKWSASFTIDVPPGFVAVANGEARPAVVQADGWTRFRYDADFPLAPYLAALSVGDLVERTLPGPVPISVWAQPATIDDAEILLGNTGEILDWLATLYGPFAWPRYGNVVTPGLGGAMEHTTAVAFGDGFDAANWEWVNVHEAAHHWWGDLVTLRDFDDLWIHEAFAAYTEALWFESQGGDGARIAWMDNKASRYRMAVGSEGAFPLGAPEVLFGRTVYDKGAWVVHMLRRSLGDERFFAGAREVLAGHAYGNVDRFDIQAGFEAAVGEDLGWFFGPWLDEVGEPRWTWSLTVHGAGPFQLDLVVEQDRPVFRLPLEVDVRTPGSTERVRFFVGGARTEQSFCFDDVPLTVELDPGHDLLLDDLTEGPGTALPWVCGGDGDDDDSTGDDDDSTDAVGDGGGEVTAPPAFEGEGCTCAQGRQPPAAVAALVLFTLGPIRRRRAPLPRSRESRPRGSPRQGA